MTTGRGRRQIMVLALCGLTAAYMQTLVTPIQSELPRLLGYPPEATAWVVTITLLAAGVSTPLSGRLGDLYGRRRTIIWLLASLVVGSLMCAATTNIVVLLMGRALQGVVMGVVPLGMSMLGASLPPRQSVTGIAVVSATMGIGGGLGLPLSAALAQYLGWPWLFWASASLGTVALLLVLGVLPRDPARSANESLDVGGGVLLTAAIAAALLTLSRGTVWGWSSWETITCAAVATAAAALWVRSARRTAHPLVQISLLAARPVLLTNLGSFAMAFGLFASTVSFPQFLVSAMGGDRTFVQASMIMVPSGLIMMLLSPFAGRFSARFGARRLLGTGGLFLGGAYVACLALPPGPLALLTANMLIGVGVGTGFAAMPALIMAAVPAERTGEANGVNALARSLGSASSAAICGAILAASATGDGSPAIGGFRVVWALGLVGGLLCFALSLVRHERPRTAP